jgi:hypothetical protein
MGPVLHGSATTTEAIRCAIQHSQESLNVLARHGINPKTVAQWRKRTSAADLPTGPTVPNSTVLSVNEETIIVAFRRHTLLAPLSRLPPGQWHGPNLCHCLKSPRLCILSSPGFHQKSTDSEFRRLHPSTSCQLGKSSGFSSIGAPCGVRSAA